MLRINVFAIVVLSIVPPGLFAQNDVASSQEKTVDVVAVTDVDSGWGSTKNVHQCGQLFFAGQFAQDDVDTIRRNAVTRVITLRTDGEIDWDEETVLRALDIEFINVPFRLPDSLTDDVFDKVRKLLKDRTQTTLFHCGSANRVGGVWLPYRVLDEGVPLQTALAEAKTIGLRTPFIEEKAIAYIRKNQESNEGESSVKPGINKNFVDPNLDVDSYIKRFEIESREVFVNREKILAACGVNQGDYVADVGAGTGLFTRMFSTVVGPQGWVYAVDISPRFIEHINRDADQLQLTNITGVLCAGNSINLPPQSVDLVFVCDTYHHFEYPQATLASVHRALKPKGRLVVLDFERIEGKTRPWLMNHVRAGKETFRGEIQEAGFAFLEEKRMDGLQENYFLVFKKN